MRWLSNKLPVPEVLEIESDERFEYLLMKGLAGRDCSAVASPSDVKDSVHALTEALRLLRNIDIVDCPFDQTLKVKLPAARRRVELNLVDPSDFDDERQGQSANEALLCLVETPTPLEELVFCHGDLCLPNVLIIAGRCSGFIDLGRAGVADKYQDLALLGRSISCDLNPMYSTSDFELILQAIGEDVPDSTKMQYYCLLDEFF
jgi:aminoglycoside phosphotransferase